jgi:hypothetical protein
LYLLAATYAHHAALQRVEKFVQRENLQAEAVGALPFPPSLFHWDGLVLTARGVYEFRMDLSDGHAAHSDPDVLQHTYYPDAPSNIDIDLAGTLPAVKTFFWFARFPVTRFHKEGTDGIVEFSDMRFPPIRKDRPASFTYRVRLSKEGEVLSQGWLK